MTRTRLITVVGVAVAIAAIGLVAAVTTRDAAETNGGTTTSVTVMDYPDAITRHLDRLAREPRPVERSALPPRHLDTEAFPTALIPRDRIVSGGPPPDGIPAIDEPVFEPAPDVEWIGENEPVLVLDLDGTVRVYPLQVMMWHEIVNDVVDDRPVTVTYCPLCNTGVAYERTLDGQVLDFGVSGALYQSGMVMYDRQTESLWTHVDGRSVVGELVGAELELLPVAMVGWSGALAAHPDALVLSRTASFMGRYGQNPYGAYGSGDAPLPGFFIGDVDDRLAPMTRVVGIRDGDVDVAVPIDLVADLGAMSLPGDARTLTVWHMPGTPWAIGAPLVGDADDTGATAVFDSRVDGSDLTFTRDGEVFVDVETGSTWNLFGAAVDGPLSGSQLDPVIHLDTFWFAWVTARPGSAVAEVDE